MKLEKLTAARVRWDSEQSPTSEQFGDIYYSADGAIDEASYVFIARNNLTERFEALVDLGPNNPQLATYSELAKNTFRVAETGFGTGLNLLLTLQLWLEKAPANGLLHYISFEKHPLSLADLQRSHQAHHAHPLYSKLTTLAEQLQAHYPPLLPGWHDIWLFDKQVRLTLWFGDLLTGLPELEGGERSRIDAWFLDGFAPSKNPQMWQPRLFQQMARLSDEGTTFATFTAAGDVRRGLQKAGFTVQKDKGWGRKREMCFGRLAQRRNHSSKTPWFDRPSPLKIGSAMVIGAGLAGASVAYKLAKAGWQVTVLEASIGPSQHASGNLAGTIHPFVTADWNMRSQWYLQGLEATLRTILPWLENKEIEGDLTGLVQLVTDKAEQEQIDKAMSRVGLPQEFVHWITQAQSVEKIGTAVSAKALFFPQGGWVSPPSIVQRCLQHPNIRVEYRQAVASFQQIGDLKNTQWQVATASSKFLADALIVATGALSDELNQQLGLSIRPVKGQVSHLLPEQQSSSLRCAVIHDGYSVTLNDGHAVTGATFEPATLNRVLTLAGHQDNLEMAQKTLPKWVNAQASALQGRIAFRPTTLDHLPVIGPVAEPAWLAEHYLTQPNTDVGYRYPSQRYQPGLFVSNGHGPRGLMSVFLAAESIVADLQGQALLQPTTLYQATHPARFAIRHWRSGKVALDSEHNLDS